ncbi:MAG: tetratricopeptide (TPR) repeat protein [Patiriisocius sp.]|jgi:tetratricopeptide (TPR) repeat protein
MKNYKALLFIFLFAVSQPISFACSMYKITRDGKTIVGNNEDWLSPNSKFWYEKSNADSYGVLYMGQLNNFAQGAINEAGLVFDGFANPELPVLNTEGKTEIYIGEAIKNVMQSMDTVEKVKNYLETINLSSLTSSQLVFVDVSGTYLIVEGDELIIGEASEKAFSNFYYSQIESEEEVQLETFKNGWAFMNATQGDATLNYCGDVMRNLSSKGVFGTQYSTVYDLETLTIRVYLFQDFTDFVEIDLKKELKKGNHEVMIADLFSNESMGKQHYSKYNDLENPESIIKNLVEKENVSEKELQEMGFNSIVNIIGYEWLNDKHNANGAIKIFKYGVLLMPNDADLYDSLGEAYMKKEDYENSTLSYKKSLVLDPSNKNASNMLVKIEAVQKD